MRFITKKFTELTNTELYEIYKLRASVFVVEQNCAYQDVDEKDLKAIHLMLKSDEGLAGYARILPAGVSYPEPSIGRVAVDIKHRGKGLGKFLMKHCMKEMSELFGSKDIVISAQSYLLKFYSEFDFHKEGTEYLEDEIPHIQMRYRKT